MKKSTLLRFLSATLIGISCNNSNNAASPAPVTAAPKSYEERVKEVENKIRNTPEWLSSVEKKAKDMNMSLDSMIHKDASWMIDEEDGKHNNAAEERAKYEQRIKAEEDKIRANPEMMEFIKKKAEQNHNPVDLQIRMDAQWIVDEADGKHKKS